jgi:hypothetical protein
MGTPGPLLRAQAKRVGTYAKLFGVKSNLLDWAARAKGPQVSQLPFHVTLKSVIRDFRCTGSEQRGFKNAVEYLLQQGHSKGGVGRLRQGATCKSQSNSIMRSILLSRIFFVLAEGNGASKTLQSVRSSVS